MNKNVYLKQRFYEVAKLGITWLPRNCNLIFDLLMMLKMYNISYRIEKDRNFVYVINCSDKNNVYNHF